MVQSKGLFGYAIIIIIIIILQVINRWHITDLCLTYKFVKQYSKFYRGATLMSFWEMRP